MRDVRALITENTAESLKFLAEKQLTNGSNAMKKGEIISDIVRNAVEEKIARIALSDPELGKTLEKLPLEKAWASTLSFHYGQLNQEITFDIVSEHADFLGLSSERLAQRLGLTSPENPAQDNSI